MSRNRAERRKTTLYQLDALFRKRPSKSPLTEAQLQAAPPHYLEGEIGNVVFVSVPVTASQHACATLRDMIKVAMGDDTKEVMIITQNIELLRVRKVATARGARIISHIEEPMDVKESELRDTIYERVRVILDRYKRDIEQLRAGKEPDCMDSHTDFASWALGFLDGLQKLVDEAFDAEENPDTDAADTPSTPDTRH